jgi:hypothetical protein
LVEGAVFFKNQDKPIKWFNQQKVTCVLAEDSDDWQESEREMARLARIKNK